MSGPQRIQLSERLNRQIVTWCGVNALQYTDGHLTWSHAPISLFPKKLRRDHFQYLVTIQPIWNKLIDKIARDRPFLEKELQFVCQADPFTSRLMDLFRSLSEEEVKTSYQLGILRSDYMIDQESSKALQIEINTISSSFGSLSYQVNQLQRYLLSRNQRDSEVASLLKLADHSTIPTVESHESLKKIASGLAEAHHLFIRERSSPSPSPVILFIVQPNERNLADQRLLEQEIWRNHGIASEFITMKEIAQRGRLDPHHRHLLLSLSGGGEVQVSVAYYRSGYTPNDYPSEEEWSARALIERSSAIKCPSLGYHLAGCKAIQAALFKPQVVESYLSEEEAGLIRRCFAEQYSLGDHDIAAALPAVIQRAIEDEGRSWVLKPQREGGGNNYYGQQLKTFLEDHRGQSDLEGFVLMRRIFHQVEPSIFFKQGEAVLSPSISELGIYGTVLSGGERAEILLNDFAGYLLRTKAEGVDEGGVATGYSVLDAISLI